MASTLKLEELIEYRGYWIQPYVARRCGKRNFLVLDQPGGKPQHTGNFSSLGMARMWIEERTKNE